MAVSTYGGWQRLGSAHDVNRAMLIGGPLDGRNNSRRTSEARLS